MIIDCVNRRLELVDRRELIFNEVKKYGYSPEGETGSLLLYSMLRWYYKVNENDFIKLNESQYFIVNILMDLINNLYISPFSISLIFHYTYQSAMTPSQSNPAGGKDHTAMDTEEESAEKAGKGGKIELKTKTNKDIYIYLFFKYLTKLIGTSTIQKSHPDAAEGEEDRMEDGSSEEEAKKTEKGEIEIEIEEGYMKKYHRLLSNENKINIQSQSESNKDYYLNYKEMSSRINELNKKYEKAEKEGGEIEKNRKKEEKKGEMMKIMNGSLYIYKLENIFNYFFKSEKLFNEFTREYLHLFEIDFYLLPFPKDYLISLKKDHQQILNFRYYYKIHEKLNFIYLLFNSPVDQISSLLPPSTPSKKNNNKPTSKKSEGGAEENEKEETNKIEIIKYQFKKQIKYFKQEMRVTEDIVEDILSIIKKVILLINHKLYELNCYQHGPGGGSTGASKNNKNIKNQKEENKSKKITEIYKLIELYFHFIKKLITIPFKLSDIQLAEGSSLLPSKIIKNMQEIEEEMENIYTLNKKEIKLIMNELCKHPITNEYLFTKKSFATSLSTELSVLCKHSIEYIIQYYKLSTIPLFQSFNLYSSSPSPSSLPLSSPSPLTKLKLFKFNLLNDWNELIIYFMRCFIDYLNNMNEKSASSAPTSQGGSISFIEITVKNEIQIIIEILTNYFKEEEEQIKFFNDYPGMSSLVSTKAARARSGTTGTSIGAVARRRMAENEGNRVKKALKEEVMMNLLKLSKKELIEKEGGMYFKLFIQLLNEEMSNEYYKYKSQILLLSNQIFILPEEIISQHDSKSTSNDETTRIIQNQPPISQLAHSYFPSASQGEAESTGGAMQYLGEEYFLLFNDDQLLKKLFNYLFLMNGKKNENETEENEKITIEEEEMKIIGIIYKIMIINILNNKFSSQFNAILTPEYLQKIYFFYFPKYVGGEVENNKNKNKNNKEIGKEGEEKNKENNKIMNDRIKLKETAMIISILFFQSDYFRDLFKKNYLHTYQLPWNLMHLLNQITSTASTGNSPTTEKENKEKLISEIIVNENLLLIIYHYLKINLINNKNKYKIEKEKKNKKKKSGPSSGHFDLLKKKKKNKKSKENKKSEKATEEEEKEKEIYEKINKMIFTVIEYISDYPFQSGTANKSENSGGANKMKENERIKYTKVQEILNKIGIALVEVEFQSNPNWEVNDIIDEIKKYFQARKGPLPCRMVTFMEKQMSELHSKEYHKQLTKENQEKLEDYCRKLGIYTMKSIITWIKRINLNIINKKEMNELINELVKLLIRRYDWIQSLVELDDPQHQKQYLQQFLLFIKSILKWNFNNPLVFIVIRKLMVAFFIRKENRRKYSDNADGSEQSKLQFIDNENKIRKKEEQNEMEEDNPLNDLENELTEEMNTFLSELHELLIGHSQFLSILIKNQEEIKNYKSLVASTKYQLLKLMNFIYLFLGEAEQEKIFTSKLLGIYLSCYQATLHPIDKEILKIIYLFERKNGITIGNVGYCWGDSQFKLLKQISEMNEVNKNKKENKQGELNKETQLLFLQQIIHENQLIPYKKLQESTFHFILNEYKIENSIRGNVQERRTYIPAEYWETYDPLFLLGFLAQIIELFEFDCRKLIENGIISYCLLGISSNFVSIRALSYKILSNFMILLKNSRFSENQEVTCLFHLIQNSIDKEIQCIPRVYSLFFSKILIILLHPDHYLYKSVNKFILYKPNLIFDDVPMFYNLFFSDSTIHHQPMRNWELEFLNFSIHTYRDHKLMKRRRVFTILFGYFDSISASDALSRNLVFSIIKNSIKTNARVAIDLIESDSLLNWLFLHLFKFPWDCLEILHLLLVHLPSNFIVHANSSVLLEFLSIFNCFLSQGILFNPSQSLLPASDAFYPFLQSNSDLLCLFFHSLLLLLSHCLNHSAPSPSDGSVFTFNQISPAIQFSFQCMSDLFNYLQSVSSFNQLFPSNHTSYSNYFSVLDNKPTTYDIAASTNQSSNLPFGFTSFNEFYSILLSISVKFYSHSSYAISHLEISNLLKLTFYCKMKTIEYDLLHNNFSDIGVTSFNEIIEEEIVVDLHLQTAKLLFLNHIPTEQLLQWYNHLFTLYPATKEHCLKDPVIVNQFNWLRQFSPFLRESYEIVKQIDILLPK